MNQHDSDEKTGSSWTRIGRRALLKIAGAASVGLPLAAYLGGGRAPWKGIPEARADEPRERESYWSSEGHFIQEKVDTSDIDHGIIRAEVDGEWQEYLNRKLPDDFIDWNFAGRISRFDSMLAMCLAGPHSGCLATYGANRGDSVFHLNAAFKGFGFFPKPSDIDDCTEEVLANWSASSSVKADVLKTFYRDRTMWDFNKLSSLELYTTKDFETHSFLNQMINPVAVINWLDIPGSFEVRAIAQLIHPQDPDAGDRDYKRVQWVNMMHDFYHGGPYPDPENPPYIACVYHVVEVFDNSPYPGRMGLRSLPAL